MSAAGPGPAGAPPAGGPTETSGPGGPRGPGAQLLAAAISHAVLVSLGILGILGAVVPGLLGYDTVAITTGSMEPSLRIGDVVVIERDRVPDPGDIVTFAQPGRDRLVTHRLQDRAEGGGWRTKGDANGGPDPWVVPDEHVIGVGRMVVPLVGMPVAWLEDGRTALVVGGGLGVALLAWSAGGLRRLRRGRQLPRTIAAWIERTGWTLIKTSAVAGMVVAGVAGQPVGSAFTAGTTNTANSVGVVTLAAPTGVNSVADCVGLAGRITVSWGAVTGAATYQVERDKGAGFVLVATVATTTWADTPTSVAVQHTYRIRARSSNFSGPLSATTAKFGPVCP